MPKYLIDNMHELNMYSTYSMQISSSYGGIHTHNRLIKHFFEIFEQFFWQVSRGIRNATVFDRNSTSKLK